MTTRNAKQKPLISAFFQGTFPFHQPSHTRRAIFHPLPRHFKNLTYAGDTGQDQQSQHDPAEDNKPTNMLCGSGKNEHQNCRHGHDSLEDLTDSF
jgi:hypothetical protein